MAAAGEAQGLSAELAMQLAKATVAGAGALAEAASESPSQLRVNVTSPNGTTQAALEGATQSETGVVYIEQVAGEGAQPGATDSVTVHYTGTLSDGTVFDSSVERGEPAEFGVNQVIPGWTEALQLMSVGDKWRIACPPTLAYGEQGAGDSIPPNTALVFEIHLIAIKD